MFAADRLDQGRYDQCRCEQKMTMKRGQHLLLFRVTLTFIDVYILGERLAIALDFFNLEHLFLIDY